MKLRGKLALVVAATTVPLVVGAAIGMSFFWRHAAAHFLREHALLRMQHGGREACERSPATFGPSALAAAGPDADPGAPDAHGRFAASHLASQGVDLHAYSSSFVSANPNAPDLPPNLRAALASGAQSADDVVDAGGMRVVRVAARTPWPEGPCAIVYARQEMRSDLRAQHDLVVGSAFVAVGLVLAVLLAAGPAVSRIRALAADVRRSAGSRWPGVPEPSGADEVAELARAFNAAAGEVRAHVDALERRERTLREFVANTDHDLTVPLTVLLGHLAELQRRMDAGEAPDASIVREAAREADYLASLVRNLGVAARLEAGEPSLARAPVDLDALVERVVARFRPVARSAGVALDFAVPETPVRFEGDETLLEQAVGNLVHNAVRHNGRGGHVAVTLEAPRGEQGSFVLRVEDDGAGMTQEAIDRALSADPAAARPRAEGRAGLGLRIVRQVAARHGLELTLRRREPRGLRAELRRSTEAS